MSLACSICLEKSMEPRRFSLSSIMRSNLSDASPVSIGTDAIASAMETSIVELNYSQYTFFLVLLQVVKLGSKGLFGANKRVFDCSRVKNIFLECHKMTKWKKKRKIFLASPAPSQGNTTLTQILKLLDSFFFAVAKTRQRLKYALPISAAHLLKRVFALQSWSQEEIRGFFGSLRWLGCSNRLRRNRCTLCRHHPARGPVI